MLFGCFICNIELKYLYILSATLSLFNLLSNLDEFGLVEFSKISLIINDFLLINSKEFFPVILRIKKHRCKRFKNINNKFI